MNIKIIPGKLSGSVTVPSSKSVGHRALICAALSGKKCTVSNISFSKDISATLNALSTLGAKFETEGSKVTFAQFSPVKSATINAGESGSTLRFLIPVAAALGIDCIFDGEGKLPLRPLDEFERLFKNNINFQLTDNHLPLHISGRLSLSEACVRGDISSQYITGLLLAAPFFNKDFEIILETKLLSKPYIDITIAVMNDFGVIVRETGNGYFINSNQMFSPADYFVEGDYSSAAFWLSAKRLKNEIDISGLNVSSRQGDKAITEVLSLFGSGDIIINGEQIPDLIPILAVTAAGFCHKTTFTGCERLKYKESDRLATTADLLTRLGGKVEITNDGLIVYGKGTLKGGLALSHNDHRIAMSAAIASTICGNEVIIDGYECVDKSYPAFFNDFIKLGGKTDEQHLGR